MKINYKLGKCNLNDREYLDIHCEFQKQFTTLDPVRFLSLIPQAAGGGQGGHKVSFPYFMAFNSLLNNMELVKRIYLNATNGHKDLELTKGK